ncbi:MAG: Crp/Fnr family transcriptional regulator [Lachnospiraceae bacterium]|nr:Crp/Fnr family transcriptional regulator [Lachnospiraceae bacterium]
MDDNKKECGCSFRKEGKYCISGIRLFRDLPMKIQGQLIERAVHTQHARGSYLVSNGDEIRSALIIRKGKVKISRTEATGDEHILDVLHDGQAVWHGIFLEDHTYHYDVICLTDVKLCEIPRQELLAVFKENPQVTMNLIGMLSTELDEAEEKVLILSIREPGKRVAEFLLYRDRRCLGGEISLKLEDIAASVNLRVETVSRHIAEFVREGLIERTGRGRLRVKDRDGLLGISEEQN